MTTTPTICNRCGKELTELNEIHTCRLPKTPTISEKIEDILKDYRQNLSQQMGFILGGRHRIDIKTANKMLIDEPTQQLLTIISDFAERITPENLEFETYESNGKTVIADSNRDYKEGHNAAVDLMKQNISKELGNE